MIWPESYNLYGLNVSIDYIYRVETGRVMIKDFELIAFAIVLKFDLNNLKLLYIENEG